VNPGPDSGEASEPLASEPSNVALSSEPSNSTARKIRVILADEHVMMRQGVAEALSSKNDIEVIGQAADGAEAVQLAI